MTTASPLEHPAVDRYRRARQQFAAPAVEYGDMTIELLPPDALAAGQVGYSVSPDGEILSGDRPDDWRASWLVIGNEDLTGDPIFVDLDDPRLPVYTAPHGLGEWSAERIADSLDGFFATLSRIAALDRDEEQARKTLAEHAAANPASSDVFWRSWLLPD